MAIHRTKQIGGGERDQQLVCCRLCAAYIHPDIPRFVHSCTPFLLPGLRLAGELQSDLNEAQLFVW